jgi:hypothetical protein
MRHLVQLTTFFVVLLVLVSSCKDQSGIVEPTQDQQTQTTSWLEAPAKMTNQMNKTVTESKVISNDTGGLVSVAFYDYQQNDIAVGRLFVEPNSLGEESVEMSMSLNNLTASVTFAPHPFEFVKPLKLNLMFIGIDLASLGEDDIDFKYQTEDGEFKHVEYDNLYVYPRAGLVMVRGALIKHFSRYGFTREE